LRSNRSVTLDGWLPDRLDPTVSAGRAARPVRVLIDESAHLVARQLSIGFRVRAARWTHNWGRSHLGQTLALIPVKRIRRCLYFDKRSLAQFFEAGVGGFQSPLSSAQVEPFRAKAGEVSASANDRASPQIQPSDGLVSIPELVRAGASRLLIFRADATGMEPHRSSALPIQER